MMILLEISEGEMMKLSLQAIAVLVVGLVLWRVMAAFSRKKSNPKGSDYFDTKYKDKWKKR